MFCIVAFIVLSILGIFSAANRNLAREALDCVLRRVTFRPCNTGFDEKMKAKILGKVIMRSEKLASFINKRFEVLAWIFFVVFLSAGIMAIRGLFLFYTTGSCNGLNKTAFCVFDPTGANNEVSSLSETCSVEPTTVSDLTLEGVDLALFPTLKPDAVQKIVFVGCYSCDYSRKAYPMIRQLADRYDTGLIYLEYPVKLKTDLLNRVGFCAYQQDQDKYWQMNDILFAAEKDKLDDRAFIDAQLTSLGYDMDTLNTCVDDPQSETAVQTQLTETVDTKFYGTPTIFIRDEAFVGPKPYRVYAIALKGLLYWLR